MSNGEKILKNYLIAQNILYREQEPVKVPWPVEKNEHKVDFYLTDSNVYIEVKGQMTYYAVNQLLWEVKKIPAPFFVFQCTEEDWIDKYDEKRHGTQTAKIKYNIDRQFKEIKELSNPEKVKELTATTEKRIQDYIQVRKLELEEWLR
jgi:hypothetical protein